LYFRRQVSFKLNLMLNYNFSVAGFGEDCYRTWESILLGAIPVVRSHVGINALFDKAPTVNLPEKYWHANVMTRELISNWPVKNEGSRALLMAQYWFDLINAYRD